MLFGRLLRAAFGGNRSTKACSSAPSVSPLSWLKDQNPDHLAMAVVGSIVLVGSSYRFSALEHQRSQREAIIALQDHRSTLLELIKLQLDTRMALMQDKSTVTADLEAAIEETNKPKQQEAQDERAQEALQAMEDLRRKGPEGVAAEEAELKEAERSGNDEK